MSSLNSNTLIKVFECINGILSLEKYLRTYLELSQWSIQHVLHEKCSSMFTINYLFRALSMVNTTCTT